MSAEDDEKAYDVDSESSERAQYLLQKRQLLKQMKAKQIRGALVVVMVFLLLVMILAMLK